MLHSFVTSPYLFLITLCVFLLVCRLQGMNKCLHSNILIFCYSYIYGNAKQSCKFPFYLETMDLKIASLNVRGLGNIPKEERSGPCIARGQTGQLPPPGKLNFFLT